MGLLKTLIPPKIRRKVRRAVGSGNKKPFQDPKKLDTSNAQKREQEKNPVLNKQLLSACKLGNKEEVIEFVEKGADVNATDENGRTPLMLLILREVIKDDEFGTKEIEDEIMQRNYPNYKKLTVATTIDKNNRIELINLLIEKGANVDAQDDGGTTALIYATLKERWDVIKLLLENGADKTIADKDGTALDLAKKKGFHTCVGLLEN